MNHPGGAGVRPPSYSNQYTPVGRTTSPMAQGAPRTPPTQMMGGPPPINTAATGGYPPQQGGMGGPPPAGPPQYNHPPQYGAGGAPMQGGGGAQYGGRNNAVEVEGAGKSKAQLIVGIDFVSISTCLSRFAELIHDFQGTTFSGVAFAFATNTEAKEDIITEWPGAGSYTKQKVRYRHRPSQCNMLTSLDSYGPLLRSIPKGCWMGSRYCRCFGTNWLPKARCSKGRMVQTSADAFRKHIHRSY